MSCLPVEVAADHTESFLLQRKGILNEPIKVRCIDCLPTILRKGGKPAIGLEMREGGNDFIDKCFPAKPVLQNSGELGQVTRQLLARNKPALKVSAKIARKWRAGGS